MAEFAEAIEGMAEACRALDFPVVSGNVSLYNETNGVAIPPTPAIGGVGLIADNRRVATLALQAGRRGCHSHRRRGRACSGNRFIRSTRRGASKARLRPSILPPSARRAISSAGLDRGGRDGARFTTFPTAAFSSRLPRWRWRAAAASAMRRIPDCHAHAAAFGEDQGRYLVAAAKSNAANHRSNRRTLWASRPASLPTSKATKL